MRPELPVLIKARAKIADPANWGKGIRNHHRPADTCCVAEAIEEVEPAVGPRAAAFRAIKKVIGTPLITNWNDASARTHAEVLVAFDKAIASAS